MPCGIGGHGRDIREPGYNTRVTNGPVAPGYISLYGDTNRLAEEHGSVNLGQGFPDFDGPAILSAAAERAIAEGKNQYLGATGAPALRRAIVRCSRMVRSAVHDPETEVVVTPGCTGALVAALLALAAPGDEILTTDFYYDYYVGISALARASVIPVPFSETADGFRLDPDRFRAALTPRTRFILLNTPHNPTGKVLDKDELAALADFCIEHNLLAISDEVYEMFCYDRPHLSIADFPGMRERTIIVSSASKTLSITGWRIGWVLAPRHLTDLICGVQQHLNVSVASPLQFAVATGLDWAMDNGFFQEQTASYERKRDMLFAGLEVAGFLPVRPEGGHFVLGRTDLWPRMTAREFSSWMTREVGITPLPLHTYTACPGSAQRYLRFAFCKKEETLVHAVERLEQFAAKKVGAS